MTQITPTALYAEFRREKFTYQMILVPEMDTTPQVTLFRQLSETHPRRAWKSQRLDGEGSDFTTIYLEEAVTHATKNLVRVFDALDTLSLGGWVLHKSPIAVEMSQEDLNDVVADKTPAALIRRILRARDVDNFGALIGEIPPEYPF